MADYYRRLPHYHPADAWVFLTWRLWGSLPARYEIVDHRTPGHAFVAQDRALEACATGPRWLAIPQIADLVATAIEQGAIERRFHELSAWCVMPNHVHLLILPRVRVPVLMRWLKGSTARSANLILHRTGHPFWQDESFDHYVRNSEEHLKIAEYVEDNPATAGLVSSPELWRWSSVGWAGQGPAPPY
jgi:putative transposase